MHDFIAKIAIQALEGKPFSFKQGKTVWKVYYDPKVAKSFANFIDRKIVVKNPIDIIHELYHVLLHDDLAGIFDRETEEFLVGLLSEKTELLLVENDYFMK